MIWSALTLMSTGGGIVRPSDFAVFGLMIRSNCVACSMGRSPRLAPLDHGEQDGDAILGALAGVDADLVHCEVDNLTPQVASFEPAQAEAIEEPC